MNFIKVLPFCAGGLAHREDAGGELHGVVHARGHAPEGEGRHHEGVQEWPVSGAHHHRRLGKGHRRATGKYIL